MAKKRHKKRSSKKTGKYCVKVGVRKVSCHRKKRLAKKAAKRHGGRVVKG